jgi:hypothetical protein
VRAAPSPINCSSLLDTWTLYDIAKKTHVHQPHAIVSEAASPRQPVLHQSVHAAAARRYIGSDPVVNTHAVLSQTDGRSIDPGPCAARMPRVWHDVTASKVPVQC